MENERKRDLTSKVLEYLQEYNEEYQQVALEYIDNVLIMDSNFTNKVDIMLQIYAKIGALEKEKNMYLWYKEYLKSMFNGIDKNIVEVGAGIYPILSEYIAEEQTTGTITAYDPSIINRNRKKIIIKKEEFKKQTDIEKADLVIGFKPCEGTLPLVENAIKNDKEFSVALCGCTHFPRQLLEIGFIPTKEKWLEYVYAIAKDRLGSERELNIDITPKTLDIDQEPILNRKKR